MRNNNLPSTSEKRELVFSVNTGLAICDSYAASSGFNYMAGVRELEGLIIIEAVAEGVGCTYLCGIRVLNGADKTLMLEIDVPHGIHYSRRRCVDLVSKELADFLIDAANKNGHFIDPDFVMQKVDGLLDYCYFQQSRESILEWAKSLGII